MKRFVFKNTADNFYYGVINCMDTPLIVKTDKFDDASFYFEKEVESIITVLCRNKIFADPIEIDFVGNYKPSRDKK